jgi:hypothetical protein
MLSSSVSASTIAAIVSPKGSRTSWMLRGVSSTTSCRRPDDLHALVLSGVTQNVGNRLRVEKPLARSGPDALIGVEQKSDAGARLRMPWTADWRCEPFVVRAAAGRGRSQARSAPRTGVLVGDAVGHRCAI